MKAGRFDFQLITEEIIPPLMTGEKFFTKVSGIYENTPDERKKVNISFGETHGRTIEEAMGKMYVIVQVWAKEQ
jgi:hypothetical protein